MIDQTQIKPKSKRLRIVIGSMSVHIAEYEKTPQGKFKLLDIAIGNVRAILNDLKSQGFKLYTVKGGAI